MHFHFKCRRPCYDQASEESLDRVVVQGAKSKNVQSRNKHLGLVYSVLHSGGNFSGNVSFKRMDLNQALKQGD